MTLGRFRSIAELREQCMDAEDGSNGGEMVKKEKEKEVARRLA